MSNQKAAPPSRPIRIDDVVGLQQALDALTAQAAQKADKTHTHTLNDLSDVLLTTPVAEGDLLCVDGIVWTNAGPVAPPIDPPTDIVGTGDVTAPGAVAEGEGTA